MDIRIDIHIEQWPIGRLIPRVTNPRTHTVEQIAQIAASMREWGWTNPILVGADNDVIAGHARLLAARHLGIPEVPVIQLGHLTEAQRRALVIADNQLALNAGWDEEVLRLELAALQEEDFDVNLLGFDDDELARLLAEQDATQGLTDEDEVPAPPDVPVTRPGELWLLPPARTGGTPHRIVCGDSTNPEAVSRVLGASERIPQPLLCVTDSPYSVEYAPEWRVDAGLQESTPQSGKVANDDRVDWSAAYALFPGDVIYAWHAGIFGAEVATSLSACGFQVRAQIIWKKQRIVISRGAYHWQHEPALYCVRKGKTANWRGDRKQSTVWEVDNLNAAKGGISTENEKTGHSTQKPVEIMRRPILNHTLPSETVYDPFLGSSSTVIACETTGRVCIGLEILPQYVDIGILRWQKFTGREAVLDGDGRTFNQIAQERRKEAA